MTAPPRPRETNRLPAETVEGAVSEVDTRLFGYPDIGGPVRIPRANLDHGVVAVSRDDVDGTGDQLDGGGDRVGRWECRHRFSWNGF